MMPQNPLFGRDARRSMEVRDQPVDERKVELLLVPGPSVGSDLS